MRTLVPGSEQPGEGRTGLPAVPTFSLWTQTQETWPRHTEACEWVRQGQRGEEGLELRLCIVLVLPIVV